MVTERVKVSCPKCKAEREVGRGYAKNARGRGCMQCRTDRRPPGRKLPVSCPKCHESRLVNRSTVSSAAKRLCGKCASKENHKLRGHAVYEIDPSPRMEPCPRCKVPRMVSSRM